MTFIINFFINLFWTLLFLFTIKGMFNLSYSFLFTVCGAILISLIISFCSPNTTDPIDLPKKPGN